MDGGGACRLSEKPWLWTSPVVSVECRYKHTTTFDDEIKIEVAIEKYNSVKLELSYIMTELVTGTVVLTAKSAHCFIDEKGKPIIVKRLFPAFDEILRREKDSE